MIAFIFPGQGSQQVGMGKALAESFPVCRETFDEADVALDETISKLCFEGPERELMMTENTQPALLTVEIATYRLLVSKGIVPEFMAGHSLGEYSAHVAAGTLSFADGLRIVRKRGRYMQEAVPLGTGAMAAVLGLDGSIVSKACAETGLNEVVSAANFNAPGQVVIAGTIKAVARATTRMLELGAKRVLQLPVSAPFHCALMKPAEEKLSPELRALSVCDPKVPVIANVDAKVKRHGADAINALIDQVSSPVLWADVVRRLASEGVSTYIEVGPGSVLSGLIRKIDRRARISRIEDPDGLLALEKLLM